MWKGKFGEGAATEHRIDLVPGARPVIVPRETGIAEDPRGRPVLKGVHRTGADRVGEPRRTRPRSQMGLCASVSITDP